MEALARASSLHVTTVRHHLAVLVRAGLVHIEDVRSGRRGRPARRYVVAPSTTTALALGSPLPSADGPPQPQGGYRTLAALLAEELATGDGATAERAAAAGRRWASRLRPAHDRKLPRGLTPAQASTVITELLQDSGFAPQLARGTGVLTLTSCPFLDVAQQHPTVVCGIHGGMIAGALDALGASTVTAELRSFTDPPVCQVILRRSRHS